MKKFNMIDENFICENCGMEVNKLGYTARDHCPHCLYSKHLDINPGDRAADCGGMMEPIDIEQKDGNYIVVQRCKKCGFIRRNKTTSEDEFDAILNIIRHKTIRLRQSS